MSARVSGLDVARQSMNSVTSKIRMAMNLRNDSADRANSVVSSVESERNNLALKSNKILSEKLERDLKAALAEVL